MSVLTSRLAGLARRPLQLRLRPTDLRRWWKLPAVGLPVVVVASLLLTSGPGETAPKVNLNLGRVWLGSDAVDQAALLDGTTVLVETRVGLPRTRGALSQVVTSGSNAGALMGGGEVTAVSGSTDIATPAKRVLPDATAPHLYASDRHLFAVDFGGDGNPGQIAVTDTAGADVQTRFHLPQGLVTATIDNAGRLWMIAKNGTIYWTDGNELHHASQGKNPAALLGTSGDSPVLVQNDTTRPTATLLDASTGQPKTTACLESEVTLKDPTLQVGDAPAGLAYATSSRDGTLLTTNLASGKCPALHIAPEGDNLGPPISAEGRVFVPNYSTGDVIIVDTATGTYITVTVLHRPLPKTFQLLTRDNIVYYNNPFGTQAGIIKPDGTVDTVSKYDPADPAKGLAAPRLATPTPTTPTPPKPNTPPPTTTPTTLPVPASVPQGRPVTAPTAPPGTLAGPAANTPSTTAPTEDIPSSPTELIPTTAPSTTLPPAPPVTQPPEPQTPATEPPPPPPPPTVAPTEPLTPQGPTQPQGSPASGGGGGGGGSPGTALPGANNGQGRPEIVTKTLDPATITLGYNDPLQATGGQTPYQWRQSGLPNGLTINPNSGQISGTPAANDAAGTDPILITLTDNQGTVVQKTFPLVVNAAPTPLPIGPAGLPVAEGPCPDCVGGSSTAGANYTEPDGSPVRFTTSGGTAPYTWTITGLPQGFSADGDTITGNALSSSRSATVLVKVTDSSSPTRTGEAEYTLAVNHAPTAPDVTPLGVRPGTAALVDFVPPASDPDGDALRVTNIGNYSPCSSSPSCKKAAKQKKGNTTAGEDCATASINNTTATVTPIPFFTGPCTFQYEISDGTLSAIGNATVTVNDNALVVSPKTYKPAPMHMATENNQFSMNFPITDGTLGSNGQPIATPGQGGGNSLTVDQVSDPDPSNAGTVSFDSDSVTFAPTPGFTGNASITYEVTDGTLSTTGTIQVNLTDTAPNAPAMHIGYSPDAPSWLIDVTNPAADSTGTANQGASDPDGDSIVISGLSAVSPTGSPISVAIDPDPSGHFIDVTNAAPACQGQSVSFNYTVSDGPPGSGLGMSTTGTITLDPEDDCPTG